MDSIQSRLSSPNLVSLDHKDLFQVRVAAELHRKLLGDSLVVQLGCQFMTKFYYSKLVETGLIKCDLYRHKEKYVAFSTYTKYPFTFMGEGKRRYFLYLSFLLFTSLVLNPARIRAILGIIKLGHRRKIKKEDRIGEILSFGVLEPYRNWKDKATGLRISNLLFEHTIAYFKNEGFAKIQGEVKKNNKPALFFWRSYGALIGDHNLGNGESYLATIKL